MSDFDVSIVDVRVHGNLLVIAAKGEGKTFVKVVDAEGLVKKLQIEVKEF